MKNETRYRLSYKFLNKQTVFVDTATHELSAFALTVTPWLVMKRLRSKLQLQKLETYKKE